MEWWHHTIHFFTHFWAISKDFVMHWIALLNHYAQAHPTQLIWIAALCAFVEALPVLGTVFPGSVTMTFIGILAGRGLVGVGATLLFTTLGAFAGDLVGYLLGRVFHQKIPRYWPFKKRPHWLAYGRAFFDKHGGKSVVLGRFIGPLRSTVPLIAGLLQMKAGRFCVAGIFSAFLWAIAYLLPGLLIGAASLALTPKATLLFLAAGVLIVVALWFIFWLADRFFSVTHRAFRRFFVWLAECCAHSKRGACVLRFFSKPGQLVDHRALEWLAWAIFFCVLFCVIAFSVMIHGALFRLNEPTFHVLMNLRYPSLHALFVVVTFFGSKSVWLSTIVLMSLFFLLSKDWRRLFFFLISAFVVVSAVYFFKSVIIESRPVGLMYFIKSNSFPSGHTTVAAVVYGLLALWATETMSTAWRGVSRGIVLTFIFLIGLSRLYLGVHWLSDVLGGFCLAAGIFLMMGLLIRRTEMPALRYPRVLRWTVLGAIVLPCLVVSLTSFKNELHRTTLQWPSVRYTLHDWRTHGYQAAPVYLSDRRGNRMLPFNIQWFGALSCIRLQLQQLGWQSAPDTLTMPGIIRRMTRESAKEHARLLPLRFLGHGPVLHMYHSLVKNGDVLSLRLWGSGTTIKPDNHPVWIGSLVRLSSKKALYHFGVIHRVHFDLGKIAAAFTDSLPPFYHTIPIRQTCDAEPVNTFLGWKNNVVLIYPRQYNQHGRHAIPACPIRSTKR